MWKGVRQYTPAWILVITWGITSEDHPRQWRSECKGPLVGTGRSVQSVQSWGVVKDETK